MNLKIQCPKCSKRFTVHEDLSGKTVECGSCDHRFPVKSESIIVERSKVYPGEHREDDFLNRLGRDASGKSGKEVDSPAAGPAYVPQVDAIMPASAGQKIALGSGLALILLYILLFFLGTSEDGIFQDVLMDKRIILGSFVGVLGALLMIFGAKNWRMRAVIFSIILVGALFALIFMRPVHLTPYADTSVDESKMMNSKGENAPLDEAGIKARVGFLGMQRMIDAMVQEHGAEGEDYVVGIFVQNINGRQYNEIEKYLLKALSIPPSEGINRYRRNNEKDSLLVISGLPLDFDTVVRRCSERLGEVTTYPEHRLIDLKLSSSLFSEPDEDLLRKLTNPEHPAFFSNNLNELKALDPTRVKDAVGRLANVRPEIQLMHEDKIVPEFMRILANESDPSLLSDLGKALRIWASGQTACVDSAAKNVKKWMENDIVVPKSFVNYLTDNSSKDAPMIIDLLWGKDPELWSQQYVALGSGAESRLLFHLEESPLNLKKSAILILDRVGTSKSLPALEKMRTSGDAEVKIIAQSAIDAIKSR